jgi:hypothetical protein
VTKYLYTTLKLMPVGDVLTAEVPQIFFQVTRHQVYRQCMMIEKDMGGSDSQLLDPV